MVPRIYEAGGIHEGCPPRMSAYDRVCITLNMYKDLHLGLVEKLPALHFSGFSAV